MSEARFSAAGVLGRGLLGGLFATCRFRVEGEENWLRFRREGKPVILVFWHEHILPVAHTIRGRGTVALVSKHADGEYIARVIERMGIGTVRGSSTRGGIHGLKGLIRVAREGHDLALTPDGPRGPARFFKPGRPPCRPGHGPANRAVGGWRELGVARRILGSLHGAPSLLGRTDGVRRTALGRSGCPARGPRVARQ